METNANDEPIYYKIRDEMIINDKLDNAKLVLEVCYDIIRIVNLIYHLDDIKLLIITILKIKILNIYLKIIMMKLFSYF